MNLPALSCAGSGKAKSLMEIFVPLGVDHLSELGHHVAALELGLIWGRRPDMVEGLFLFSFS